MIKLILETIREVVYFLAPGRRVGEKRHSLVKKDAATIEESDAFYK